MRALVLFASALALSVGLIGGAWSAAPGSPPLRGRLLIEAERAGGHWSLFAVKPDGREARRLGSGVEAVASPDGSHVVFVAVPANCPRCPDTYLVNTAGGRARRIKDGAENPHWSPNGRRIAYVDGGAIGGLASVGGDLYVMRSDGHHSRPLVIGRGSDDQPSWSPDGRQLVFAHSAIGGSRNEIVVVRADGKHRRVVARHGPVFAGEPVWSARNAIAYTAYVLKQRRGIVAVTDPSGLRKRILFSQHLTEFHYLGWSPDGLRLVVDEMHWAHRGHGRELEFGRIWVVTADGRARSKLTSGRFDDRDAVWSPDGRWIAFTRCRSEHCRVMLVRSSGGGLRRVPISPRNAYIDSWAR